MVAILSTIQYSKDSGTTYTDTISVKNGETLQMIVTFTESVGDTPSLTSTGLATNISSSLGKSSSTVLSYAYTVPDTNETATLSISAVGSGSNAYDDSQVPSNNTFTIDNTAPTAFTTGGVVTTGAPVVANYWNSTNTGLFRLVQV